MATFDAISIAASGLFDIFLAKYNSNGQIQWATKAGGTAGDAGFDLKIDGNGIIYLAEIFPIRPILVQPEYSGETLPPITEKRFIGILNYLGVKASHEVFS